MALRSRHTLAGARVPPPCPVEGGTTFSGKGRVSRLYVGAVPLSPPGVRGTDEMRLAR